MSFFDQIIQTASMYKMQYNDVSFFVGPEIPQKKLMNAMQAYGDPNMGPVAALYDATVFGSGKEGLMLTENGIFYHYMLTSWFLPWNQIGKLDFIFDGDAKLILGMPGAEAVVETAINKTMLMYILSTLTGVQPMSGFIAPMGDMVPPPPPAPAPVPPRPAPVPPRPAPAPHGGPGMGGPGAGGPGAGRPGAGGPGAGRPGAGGPGAGGPGAGGRGMGGPGGAGRR